MQEDSLNRNLKWLASLALVVFLFYVVIQVGSYFMNLVTIFGLSLVLAYVLIEPVNLTERLLKHILPPLRYYTAPKTFTMFGKSLTVPKFGFSMSRRIISIVTIYIAFAVISIYIAYQIIPQAVYQVVDFAKNVPGYAVTVIEYVDNARVYLHKKFPQAGFDHLYQSALEQKINIPEPQKIEPTQVTSQEDKIVYDYTLVEEKALQVPDRRSHFEKAALETAMKFKYDILKFIQNNAPSTFNNVVSIASSTLLGVSYLITILVLSFYFLMDGKKLLNSLNKLFSANILPLAQKIELSIHESLLGFLKGQVYLGILTGFIMFFVYLYCGVPYAFFLSVLIALAEIIPVVGAPIGFLPAVIIVLLTNPMQIFPVVVAFILWQTLRDNIIAPKVVGEIIGLHPVSVIFALWIGYQVAGLLGILFAIPIASVINVLITLLIIDPSQETVL